MENDIQQERPLLQRVGLSSHEEMVVEDLGDGKVICEDGRGRYITYKDRLDNGLADQNRASLKRI